MTNIREWPKDKLPSVEILQLLANLRYEVRVLRKLTWGTLDDWVQDPSQLD